MRRIKYGTYSAEMAAADWRRILESLAGMREEYKKIGLTGLAEDCQYTIDKLMLQVTEERV